ncbi:hypothetical protein [Pseudovibrio sp. Ad26]|uniref:capsular polysaccharide export protein, LipB/KpsS family n=1 Tax=Pseudovibrio sp. Ad26 TaxID=989410 RepID=UPI0007AEB799|nr:hypothetical protein [Pseudovibrio sp. Ad26]KZL05203.1 Capsule polysaccharide biosynthesis protein [Pseudovibrio sp. Ad26]
MYLLAGFNATMFEGFRNEGFEIGAWIQIVEKHQKLVTPEDVETISWRDFTLCKVPHTFAADMDPAFAKRVRERAYPYFIRMQDRMYWYNFERTDTWLDTVNLLESMIHYFHALIKRNDISTVISTNVPHEGPHIILHFVAQELGIESILTTQSLVPNAFWIIKDIEDFGHFQTGFPKTGVSLPVKKEPQRPFYMANVQRSTSSEYLKFLMKYLPKIGLNFLPYLLGFRKRSFKKSLFKLDQKRRVRQILNSINYDAPKEGERFIYFPLHLQPEMTTDALGHEYCDQLLALEELLRKVPEDVYIYVKENPKQSGQMREASFFKRLQALPRVRYLPREVNSFDLIKESLAVATITGTAGWEALQMGKPVITFGSAWYRSLHGSFEWSDTFKFEDVLSFEFDYTKLEAGTVWLSQYLREGIVDPVYSVLKEDYDASDNARIVAREVLEFIAETQKRDQLN